jgi:hypothetical protein
MATFVGLDSSYYLIFGPILGKRPHHKALSTTMVPATVGSSTEEIRMERIWVLNLEL